MPSLYQSRHAIDAPEIAINRLATVDAQRNPFTNSAKAVPAVNPISVESGREISPACWPYVYIGGSTFGMTDVSITIEDNRYPTNPMPAPTQGNNTIHAQGVPKSRRLSVVEREGSPLASDDNSGVMYGLELMHQAG